MPDKRITDLKKWWEKVYAEVYSLTPYWAAREQKLAKSVLAYADRLNPEDGLLITKEALKRYLIDNNAFLDENRHQFHIFHPSMTKWFVVGKKKAESRLETKPEPQKAIHVRRCPDDTEIAERLVKDPLNYIRGMKTTYGLGLKINAAFAKKVAATLKELVGEQKAKKIYEDAKKLDAAGIA